MDVSENRRYPQIIQFNKVFHYKPSILGFFPLFLETPHMGIMINWVVEAFTYFWNFPSPNLGDSWSNLTTYFSDGLVKNHHVVLVREKNPLPMKVAEINEGIMVSFIFLWVVVSHIFGIFNPNFGKMIHFDGYFSKGWNHQLVIYLNKQRFPKDKIRLVYFGVQEPFVFSDFRLRKTLRVSIFVWFCQWWWRIRGEIYLKHTRQFSEFGYIENVEIHDL